MGGQEPSGDYTRFSSSQRDTFGSQGGFVGWARGGDAEDTDLPAGSQGSSLHEPADLDPRRTPSVLFVQGHECIKRVADTIEAVDYIFTLAPLSGVMAFVGG